jgi:CRISPR/Cas system Type II protein with McrA/HNH and RuvC-like nuclease domain
MFMEQDGKCLYCDTPFGSTLRTPCKHIRTRMEFDHIMPKSFSADHRRSNLALACSFCNQWKRDKVFPSVEAIRDFIKGIWQKKQITVFAPDASCDQ